MNKLLQSVYTGPIILISMFQLLWFVMACNIFIPSWETNQKIMLVALLAVCIIIFGYILYHLWFREKISRNSRSPHFFLIKVVISLVGIGWFLFISGLTSLEVFIGRAGFTCTSSLSFEHTYPHNKTIYVFANHCVPDGDSGVWVRESIFPIMKHIGSHLSESWAENASSYIVQKGDVLFFEGIRLAEYNLNTGQAKYR